MGRVGSTAIAQSANRQLHERWSVHVHRLSLRGLVDDERMFRCHYRERNQIFQDLSRAHYVARNLPRWCASEPVDIITMVRDPGQRAVSDFMQWLDWDHPDLARRIRAAPDPLALRGELLSAFRSDRDTGSRPMYRRIGPPFGWFDEELSAVFGIDVFAEDFPRERGYSILENEVARVLLLRYEDMSMIVEQAMTEFLGVSNFALERINRTKDKKNQASLYDALLADIAFDKETLDEIYNSERVRHFYTESEILAFRSQWVRNG